MNLSALDECAALIREAAEPLPRGRRHRFYERVSELLSPAMNSCATCRLNSMLWERCLAMAFIL
jgi:hypothetical protein